ncbi:hypothetical protein FRC12_018671, partial [Ceratobasidium sp. 428]
MLIAPVHPRTSPLPVAQAQPPPGQNQALSSDEDGQPSRTPPPRPPELERPVHCPHPPALTALVTPPMPVTAKHELSRMDVDAQPPRSAPPSSPTSSTGGLLIRLEN